jgi:hypothetical protein
MTFNEKNFSFPACMDGGWLERIQTQVLGMGVDSPR